MPTTYNSDGSWTGGVSSIATLYAGATAGDTITVPVGPFIWGAGNVSLNVYKAITITGIGGGTTTITLASNAPSASNGTFNLFGPGFTIKDMTIVASAGRTFVVASASGFRITNIIYDPGAAIPGYFLFCTKSGSSGRVDNCTIRPNGIEAIYCHGPETAWSSQFVGGTSSAVFVEDNIFLPRFSGSSSAGYVCDANANSNLVVRFNKVQSPDKVDGHGWSSNRSNPVNRGVHSMETYGNLWTYTSGSNWPATEIRGGVGYKFANAITGTNPGLGYYRLTDYGVLSPDTVNFAGVYQTPVDYPIPDQIGIGPGALHTQTGGANPYYIFANKKGGALSTTLSWKLAADVGTRPVAAVSYPIGTTVIGITSGPNYTGNYIKFPADSQYYLITSGYTTTGSGNITISPPLAVAVPASTPFAFGCITNYRGQLANPSASFVIGPTAPDLIQADRDYFQSVASFNGSSGVGTGTAAAMAVIAGNGVTKKVGAGFWVTDEGTWNQKFSGTISVSAILPTYWCEIVSLGTTTTWTSVGASSTPFVGEQFLATAVGTGDGMVKPAQGRLYTWNGSAFTVNYNPFPYPFDSSPAVPVLYGASINAAGTQLTLTFSESCTNGINGGNGITMSPSGGAATAAYNSGSGSTSYVYNISRPITSGEVVTISYTQPGDGIETTSFQVELPSFTGQAVTNNSTASSAQLGRLRTPGAAGGGF